MSMQTTQSRPRGTLKLTPAKPAPSKPGVRMMVNKTVAENDQPEMFPVFGEQRSVSIRPSAIGALVEGVGKFKGKTWWFPRTYSKKNKRCLAIPLDTDFAFISYWLHSRYPKTTQTPDAARKREYDLYVSLKFKYEGKFPGQ